MCISDMPQILFLFRNKIRELPGSVLFTLLGTTPERRQFSYPYKLVKTKDHELLLQEYHNLLEEGTEVILNDKSAAITKGYSPIIFWERSTGIIKKNVFTKLLWLIA